MELGEKLLQKQLAALYPHANPDQEALNAARTGAEDNNIEKKTAVKCVEVEDDSDNDKVALCNKDRKNSGNLRNLG
jgi:hypothetical protein